MEMIRISILGIAGVLLAFFLKETRPEYETLVTLSAGMCILGIAVGKMQYLFSAMQSLQTYLPLDETFLATLIKMVGIAYIGQFSSGICQDAGYSAISGQIELFARLSILTLSMPILLALFDVIAGFAV